MMERCKVGNSHLEKIDMLQVRCGMTIVFSLSVLLTNGMHQ